MRRALVVVAVVMGASAVARAADVRGRVSAIFTGQEDVQDGDEVGSYPLYGLAGLEVRDLAVPGMDDSRLVLQGWGRLQAGEDDWEGTTGDLMLAFLQLRSNRLTLRLGRQQLIAGAARMDTIDGALARVSLPFGFSVEGFWGLLALREFDYDGEAWEGGGRLAFNLVPFDHPGEVGVSYVQRRTKEGDLFRSTLGVDAFTLVGPTRWVGFVAVDPTGDEGLVEAKLAGSWALSKELLLSLDYERTVPERFLAANSIFTVFTDVANDMYGGAVGYSPSPYWDITVAGHGIVLDLDGIGYRADFRVVTYREPSHRSLIGGSLRRLDSNSIGYRQGGEPSSPDGYVRGRLFTALEIIEAVRVVGDLYYYAFDEELNDVRYSTLGRLSLIYDLAPSLQLVGSAAGGSTPWADGFWEGLVRVTYGYDVDLAREVGP